MEEIINTILRSITLEEKAQEVKFGNNAQQNIRQLKQAGLILHPIKVIQKSFGFADYPEVKFQVPFMGESRLFRDGVAIEIGIANEQPVKGVLLELEGNKGELRIYSPDFPDWIEDNGVYAKIAPDSHTLQIMRDAMRNIKANKKSQNLFFAFYLKQKLIGDVYENTEEIKSQNNNSLNESQQKAVQQVVRNHNICIIHGPPGTGKTTTLVEAVMQLVLLGKKVCIATPSNTAVDHFAKQLIYKKVAILRVGNNTKVDAQIYNYTVEGKTTTNPKQVKELKQWKQKAEAYRKMALQYKRSFGKSEREQRQLLFKEVKDIRTQIKKIQSYNEDKLFEEANVYLGTPVALYDVKSKLKNIDTLIIDEAGQCIAPLAWCIFPLAERIVLAGDHLQLPPVVLSDEANDLGLSISILETAINAFEKNNLLNVQYRMREAIANFSNNYFYNNALQTPPNLKNIGNHILFIDTAGSGMEERVGEEGMSLQNDGEIKIVEKLIEEKIFETQNAVFISPYNGQVLLAKQTFAASLHCSTIDSYQGQEKNTVIISLVRSNENNVIGFLKDYRRLNVAITRAKEKLIVIGDSATIGNDNFFKQFLQYVEANGTYQSVWEYEL